MNRNQITSLLKINGFSADSVTDEEVRAVLLSARYSEDEVNAALVMLREEPSQFTRVDGLHKVFYSDKSLHPHEVSGLLGVDIDLESPISARSRRSTFSLFQFIFIWFASVVFAVTGILFYMYINQIGLFHPSISGAI